MQYTIIKKPSFSVLGKGKVFELAKFFKEGPAFWKKFVSSADYQLLMKQNCARPGPTSEAVLLSVYFPDEKGNKDEFLDVLGLEADSEVSSSDFGVYTVPAATYAEFNCTYKTAVKTNRYIYSEWFAATGYERDGNKPDIAAYFPIPFRPMGEMGVRWWIPVIGKI